MTERQTDDGAGAEPAPVGIVVVSHSAPLAEATAELVRQLANVPADGPSIVPAGGIVGGEIGTDAARIADAVAAADRGAGVVVIVDLGSAVLSAQTALAALAAPELAARTRISAGPFVEGAFVAAVQAAAGDRLDGVLVAAEEAAAMRKIEGRAG
ncbi:MAG: dihydroxyacetone kinase phosphoryl donor subunit DhaM [Chloroflexota bacterium]